MNLLRFTHEAMATTFELRIADQPEAYAAQAARAAFDELEHLEGLLSRFVPTSDIAQLNRLRVGASLPVSHETMECLSLAGQIYAQTGGAFDVTVGGLRACWRDGVPSEEALAAARRRTGMDLLVLDPPAHRVSVRAEGVCVDLGALGKGYAVDALLAVLAEWGIHAALVHGGQSSVRACGPDWTIALRHPLDQARTLGQISVGQAGLGASGALLHGQHILDPRTGRPASGTAGAWAIAPTAAEADALSTAFMVLPPGQVASYCAAHGQVGAAVLLEASPQLRTFGPWPAG